jgi:hypothetical protein
MRQRLIILLALAAMAGEARADDNAMRSAPGDCKAQAGSAGNAIGCTYSLGDATVLQPGQWSSTQLVAVNLPAPDDDGTSTIGTLDGLAKSYTLGLSQTFTRTWGQDDLQVLLLGLTAKGASKNHRWKDPTDLTGQSGSRQDWSLSAFTGSTLGGGHNLLAYARFTAQQSYADAPTSVVCPPGTGGPVTCTSGSMGPPVRQRTRIASIELDTVFPYKTGTGASITFSRDSVAHVNGVDLPVVLWVTSTSTPLSLGFDASWSNDPSLPRKFGLSLFVSTSGFSPFRLQ